MPNVVTNPSFPTVVSVSGVGMFMHLKIGFILASLFIALQVLDGYSTWKCLTTFVGHEANTISQFVFNKLGIIPGLLAIKIPAVIAIFILAFMTKYPDYILTAPVVGYVAVVVNNFLVLKKR